MTSSTAPSSSSSLTFPESTATPLRGGPALRWGVIGTGEIAGDLTDALHAHTDQRVVAVSSRTLDRAERFAASHPQVRTAVIPAMPSDIHDLDGLRLIGAELARQD